MPDDNCDNESVASMSTSIVTSGSDDHDSFENIAGMYVQRYKHRR